MRQGSVRRTIVQRRGFSFCFLTDLYSEGGRDRGKEHGRKEITDGNGTRD